MINTVLGKINENDVKSVLILAIVNFCIRCREAGILTKKKWKKQLLPI